VGPCWNVHKWVHVGKKLGMWAHVVACVHVGARKRMCVDMWVPVGICGKMSACGHVSHVGACIAGPITMHNGQEDVFSHQGTAVWGSR